MAKKLDRLTQIYDLLYALGVRATIMGFFETSCAIYLFMENPREKWFSIMAIYRRISALYHVDLADIDPRIRKVIHIIWRDHPDRLRRVAGQRLDRQPTPRQFILMLSRYLSLRNPR